MFDELGMFRGYAGSLAEYARTPISDEQSALGIQKALRHRERSFLDILQRGVYSHPQSPYYRLLKHCDIDYPDIAGWVRELGIERTLGKLYDAGVYITLEEFKLRKPIKRGGLVFQIPADAFDNPLHSTHFVGTAPGSRTRVRRSKVDLGLLSYEAAYYLKFLEGFGLTGRPIATWRSLPPATAGINVALRFSKSGQPLQKWFSPTRKRILSRDWKFQLFLEYTLRASRSWNHPIPAPDYVPLEKAATIARWLVEQKEHRRPAVLNAPASAAVRVCLAAERTGLDIAGSFFMLTGEPLTPAKSRAIENCGCRVASVYHSSESGVLGIPCAESESPTDLHLATDKLAFLSRRRRINRREVDSLVLTTLMKSCPKLMLNVETGDYGSFRTEGCSCPFGDLGLHERIQDIRSYEKMTSEGMHFLGSDLIQLLEEVLPRTFGGSPIDYQMVEVENGGLTRIELVVHPEVGDLNELRVVAVCIDFLRSVPGGRNMAELWRQAGTLRVVRRTPYVTSSSKVLPIHVLN